MNERMTIGPAVADGKLDEVLAGSREHPLVKAMLALIDKTLMAGVEQALDENQPDKATHMLLGETRALWNLKTELVVRTAKRDEGE
jgi:hypothetical protein